MLIESLNPYTPRTPLSRKPLNRIEDGDAGAAEKFKEQRPGCVRSSASEWGLGLGGLRFRVQGLGFRV